MKFGLNRSQLKNIALVFMVLDNTWLRFSTSFSSVAHLITRFVAPLFAWLMVDGFFHTKSRGRYCSRLWMAAGLMQVGNVISFGLFGQRGITDNIFLTLAFGFTIIWLFELAKTTDQRKRKIWLRIAAISLTVLALALSIVLYIPLPFGELPGESVPGVNHVEVTPVVPFGNPEDMVSILEIITIQIVIIHEGIRFLLRYNAALTCRAFNSHQLV